MLPLSSGHGIADSGGPALKVLPDQLVSRLHTRNDSLPYPRRDMTYIMVGRQTPTPYDIIPYHITMFRFFNQSRSIKGRYSLRVSLPGSKSPRRACLPCNFTYKAQHKQRSLASHCWGSQVWTNVMLPSWNACGAWRTKP